MAKAKISPAARANAARSVAGLRRAGRIGVTNPTRHVSTAAAMGPRQRASGYERAATKNELRALRRTQSRSFQRRQGISLSGGNSH